MRSSSHSITEIRYGLHHLPRKMWCRKGAHATGPLAKRRYQNDYLYESLEVGANGSEFLFTHIWTSNEILVFWNKSVGLLSKRSILLLVTEWAFITKARIEQFLEKRSNYHTASSAIPSRGSEISWRVEFVISFGLTWIIWRKQSLGKFDLTGKSLKISSA